MVAGRIPCEEEGHRNDSSDCETDVAVLLVLYGARDPRENSSTCLRNEELYERSGLMRA